MRFDLSDYDNNSPITLRDYLPELHGVGCGIVFCMHSTRAKAKRHWTEHCEQQRKYWDSWREKNGFDPDVGYQGQTEPLLKAGWLTYQEAKARRELKHG